MPEFKYSHVALSVCKDVVDIFRKSVTTLKQVLPKSVAFFKPLVCGFSWFRVLVPLLRLYCFLPAISFLFYLFSVLVLFVLFLCCICAGFKIGSFAIKPSR
jgi:hypothetical protein